MVPNDRVSQITDLLSNLKTGLNALVLAEQKS
jgi:hypothetical protein